MTEVDDVAILQEEAPTELDGPKLMESDGMQVECTSVTSSAREELTSGVEKCSDEHMD